ncbi:MAG: hypothetical protein RR854_00120 [Muribaculaceae bacterium]
MKEKILSELKLRVGKTSLSEKTISDYIAGILPFITDEAQLTDQFYTTQVAAIKSMDGNFSHDVAAQVDEAKKNLVPTPPITPQTTPPITPQVTPPVEEKPQWAKDLDAKLSAIEQANLTAQKQAQRAQLIESVKKIALTKDAANEKSGWATNAGVLETAVRLVQIEDADTVETVGQKCQQEYNSLYKSHFGAANAVPGVGGGGREETDWSEEKRRLQERGDLPKDLK